MEKRNKKDIIWGKGNDTPNRETKLGNTFQK